MRADEDEQRAAWAGGGAREGGRERRGRGWGRRCDVMRAERKIKVWATERQRKWGDEGVDVKRKEKEKRNAKQEKNSKFGEEAQRKR